MFVDRISGIVAWLGHFHSFVLASDFVVFNLGAFRVSITMYFVGYGISVLMKLPIMCYKFSLKQCERCISFVDKLYKLTSSVEVL